ncbi:hypothetical protein [Brucella endophytica]|nr:hypothetical protein [Brucella endophytica]
MSRNGARAEIGNRCHAHAAAISLQLEFRQSNHDGQIADWIQ